MRGSGKLFQRGSNFDKCCFLVFLVDEGREDPTLTNVFFLFFLVDEGREDPNTT